MAAVVAMQRMALGMVVTTRRKTRFPTGVTDSHKKAKPTTAATVQKAAGGRSKSPPLAVKKQLIVSPSLTLPKGREFILAVL